MEKTRLLLLLLCVCDFRSPVEWLINDFCIFFKVFLIESLFFRFYACIVRYLPAFKPNHTYEFSHTFQLLPFIMIAFPYTCECLCFHLMNLKKAHTVYANAIVIYWSIFGIFDLGVDKITNGLHFVTFIPSFFSFAAIPSVPSCTRLQNKTKAFSHIDLSHFKIDCRFCLIEQQHEKCKLYRVSVCVCAYYSYSAFAHFFLNLHFICH